MLLVTIRSVLVPVYDCRVTVIKVVPQVGKVDVVTVHIVVGITV